MTGDATWTGYRGLEERRYQELRRAEEMLAWMEKHRLTIHTDVRSGGDVQVLVHDAIIGKGGKWYFGATLTEALQLAMKGDK